MNDYELKVMNTITIETVTRGIIDETSKWDFKTGDYIKLANALLDYSITKPSSSTKNKKIVEILSSVELSFPLTGESVKIKEFDRNTDFDIVNKWLSDEIGRWFLFRTWHTTLFS